MGTIESMRRDALKAVTKRFLWQNDDDYERTLKRAAERDAGQRAGFDQLHRLVYDRDLPMPYVYSDGRRIKAVWLVGTVDDLRSFRRLVGWDGPWEKGSNDGAPFVAVETAGLTLTIRACEAVCERVDTGEVEAVEQAVEVCPLCEADLESDPGSKDRRCSACEWAMVAPKTVMRETEQPVIRWDCPDLNGTADD